VSRSACLATALLIGLSAITAACSDSVGSDAPTSTSAPCSPEPSGTPAVAPTTVVPLSGVGDRNVGLPGELPLPLLVHARHDGPESFVVSGVDASGNATQVFASALGKYDGTFAVGFVDACANPTTALHVAATGKWHLDFANAKLAPKYDNAKGVKGKGDAVLSYIGARTSVRITYAGTTSTDPRLRKSDAFAVRTFGAKGPGLLVQSIGFSTGTVVLAAGPVFIAVTAQGAWTISAARA
jgi:hypothetical protein